MIDQNKFQFVRRIENIMSSTPLYEKIIIDRKTNEVHGYTFESPKDESYSEHYIYQQSDCGNQVSYDMYLYRNPGMKSFLRTKAHSWGVSHLNKLIVAQ